MCTKGEIFFCACLRDTAFDSHELFATELTKRDKVIKEQAEGIKNSNL